MAKKTIRKTTRLRIKSSTKSQVLEEESTQKRTKVVRAKKQATETSEDTTQTGEKKKNGKKGKEPVEEEATLTKDKKKGGLKNSSCKNKSLPPEVESAVAKFVDHATNNSMEVLRNEFKTVQDKSKEVTNKPHANHGTARHPDIPCFEDTRLVILSPETSAPTDDFMHANRVKLDNVDRDFIATQAPKDNQLEVFWRMIFQEACPVVICLTPFTEEGVSKCDEFWPMENGQYKYYGKMFINNKKVEHQERYSVYTLEVLPEGCSNSAVTRLVHYVDWPDKGVAVSGRVILRINKWIKTLESESPRVSDTLKFVKVNPCMLKLQFPLHLRSQGNCEDSFEQTGYVECDSCKELLKASGGHLQRHVVDCNSMEQPSAMRKVGTENMLGYLRCVNHSVNLLCKHTLNPYEVDKRELSSTELQCLEHLDSLNGPACVISSAGTGRAGTYIGIDTGIAKLFKGNEINIVDLVLELRQQRALAVDNELQYLFIYSTVLDYIRAKVPKHMGQISKFFQAIREM